MMERDDVQLVAFRVADQDFAFNIFQVERILRYQPPTRLPKAPEFLEGVLRYEETAIPVVDLRKRLSVAAPLREETRTMLLDAGGGRIGVIVDAVIEVLQVPADAVAAPPPYVRGLAAEYVAGLVVRGDRTVIVLHAGKLLTSAERVALEAAAPAVEAAS